MRILITTGLSAADVGGPAQYGPNLKYEFEEALHEVRVCKYGSIESALIKIWPQILWADIILALDTFSVGVPAVLAGKLLGKKVIVRIGGDFLWESYVERTGAKITLRDFNLHIPPLALKEKWILRFTQFLIKNAYKLVFNTEWQRSIWSRNYSIPPEKSFVIRNYIPDTNISPTANKGFLWAGRRIKLKNVDMLEELAKEFNIDVVSNTPHIELQKKIKNCYAVLLPSFSEVCPNLIIESVSFGKPFIMTEETGIREIYERGGIFVNPFDKEAWKQAISLMSKPEQYEKYVEELRLYRKSRPWRELAKEFLNLI